jgi:molybdopterin synthase sulfur carrier subunit
VSDTGGGGSEEGGVTVRVRVPAALRQVVAGRASVDSGVPATGPDGSTTVGALLDHLAGTLPDLERRVRDEQGGLRRHVNLFVGTTNIRDLDGLDTVLADGDEVAILPAVSGGAVGIATGEARGSGVPRARRWVPDPEPVPSPSRGRNP